MLKENVKTSNWGEISRALDHSACYLLKENVKNSNWGDISSTPGHSACLKRMSRTVTGVRYLGHRVIVHA